MNKTLKVILTTLAIVVLVIGLVGFGITAFVSWVWGGVRFTPEAAIEAVGRGFSEYEYLEASSYRFYYHLAEGKDDWIAGVIPVTRNEIGMYYAIADPRSYPVIAIETGDYAGSIITIEGDDRYYHFYLPPIYGYDPEALPDFIKAGYDAVTVDGKEIEVYKHSYFVTEADIEEFEINGIRLVIDK